MKTKERDSIDVDALVMLFEYKVKNYYEVKAAPPETLFAFRFPWSFADGAKIRLMPMDGSEYLDMPITGCYMRRKSDYSIEVKKEA